MTTPAQATGHPSHWITDWPVQGPTDEGIRAADCWWAQNRLPANPHCVDCQKEGNVMVPGWSRSSMACPGAGLLGETITRGGSVALGFALGAEPTTAAAAGPAQPFYDGLAEDQRAWILNGMIALNDSIVKATGTTCPGFASDITHAAACFQLWYNTNFGNMPPAKPIRADGVVDEDTLCMLQSIAAKVHPEDFPTPFPDPAKAHCQPPCPVGQSRDPKTGQCVSAQAAAIAQAEEAAKTAALQKVAEAATAAAAAKPGLSTAATVGIGLGGAAVVGGIIYLATRDGGSAARPRRRSRRR